MKLEDMVTEVGLLVQDSSLEDSYVSYINEAFLQAAHAPGVFLPDLKRIDLATTVVDQNMTLLSALAKGFSGGLSRVNDPDITIFSSLEDLLDDMNAGSESLADVGKVSRVALEGSTLWYHPIPETPQTIQMVLFGNPPILVADNDEPLCFPPNVHRNIGVHGAAMIAYNLIENEIDDDKTNTMANKIFFEKGITDLQMWIGKNRNQHKNLSTWNLYGGM